MVKVGDRIRLSSGKGPDREGVVIAVVGSMVRVRWPSASETTVIPAPGSLTVLASSGAQAPPAVRPQRTVRTKAVGNAAPKKAAAKTGGAKTATSSKKAASKTGAEKATSSKKAASKTGAEKATTSKKAASKTGAEKATTSKKAASKKSTGKRSSR
jgi:hypothetical protein